MPSQRPNRKTAPNAPVGGATDSKILRALKGEQAPAVRASPPTRQPAPKGASPPAAPRAAADKTGRVKPARPKTPAGRTPREGLPARPGRLRAAAPRAVAGGVESWRGLSLRWKIVAALVILLVVTGLGTFFAAYLVSIGQLQKEVDSKGVATLKALANLEDRLWIAAALSLPGGSPQEKKERFVRYMKEAMDAAFGNPQWEGLMRNTQEYPGALAAWADAERRMGEDLQRLGFLTPDTAAKCVRSCQTVLAIVQRVETQDPQRWEPAPDVRARMDPWLALLQHPAGALQMYRQFQGGGDISGISITFDASTRGPYRGIGGQIRPPDMPAELQTQGVSRVVEGVTVTNGMLGATPMRSFVLEKDAAPYGQLLFVAFARTAEIRAAKVRLMLYVFVAILVAIALGMGAAFSVSGRITEPLKMLMQDVAAVKDGDLEHETIPRTTDEIGQLAVAFNDMTRALQHARQAEIAQKEREHELTIAHQIQANLLPKQIPIVPSYELRAFYKPAKEVGGDYYDLIQIDEDHLGVVVADVSGKGVPGALVMSMARMLLRMEADRAKNLSPADTLRHVNRLLARDIKKGMFVTALYWILDRRRHVATVCSAGHNPLVVWRARERKIVLVNPHGIALGFDRGSLFDKTVKEEEVRVDPGDVLVGYTDGVVEAMNEAREEYGDERFHTLVRKLCHLSPAQLIQGIVQDLEAHQGPADQHDDITLVVLRRTA